MRRRAAVAACGAAVAAVVLAGIAASSPSWDSSPEPAAPAQAPAVQDPATSASPAGEYAAVVELVNQADRTVVPLSKLVSKTLDDKVVKRMERVLAGKDAAAALLDEASARLAAVTPQLDPQAEGAKAPVLADSISARAEMLRYGSVVLDASIGAYKLTDEVVDVWQHLIDGASALRSASESVTGGTTRDVRRALSHDTSALSHFQEASALIEQIAQAAPAADLSPEREYVSLQEQAAQEAIATDRALLDEDAKRAQRHNAAYEKTAAAAAKAAKTLPATTDDLVKSLYYSLGADGVSVQEAQNRYEAAARRASEDDKRLAAEDGTAAGATGADLTGAETAKESRA